ILTIEKHPDADKLSLCSVDIGSEVLQIVCGASNIFEGALVPVALIGAKLPGDFNIKKGKIRGVNSFGMLCSGSELELTEEDYPGADVDGIMILDDTLELGTSLRDVLGLTDTVFEIEIGANRPDCLCVLGVARECAAALGKDVTPPTVSFIESGGNIADYVSVAVNDPVLCERYIARAVKNVKIGPSPKWLKERLISAGVRSINNVVDITNFVMLETGQPMHAFDHSNIRGNQIIVRRAQNGEVIKTLDDKDRKLTDDMLLICDGEGPIAIAGVMGAQNSEIKDDTTTIIFESAKFAQGNTRRTSRSLGLPTESAMRFSKGVDTAGCKTAIDRALHLIELLDAGQIVSGEIDVLSADISPRNVIADSDKINARLGTDLTAKKMAALLEKVYIKTKVDGNILTCDIPSFRGDITIGEDISEEVARMFGYDNIPTTKMTGEIIRGIVPTEERAIDRIKSVLVSLGCFECVTYSFAAKSELDKLNLNPDDNRRKMVKIINPLGDEQGYMRTSPVPDILKVVSNNLKQKVVDIALYESGRVYAPTSGDELPEENKYICIALCGKQDFFSLKGVVENLLESFGILDTKLTAGASVYYHPGRAASLHIDGEKVGELGEIHPDVTKSYEIDKRVYVAELSLHAIIKATDDVKRYETLPRFPAAERDLALTLDESVPAGDVLDCIKSSAGEFFESAKLFDVYTGDQLGAGKKSLAFSIVFRAKERTLLDEEANAARDAVVAAAGAAFGAKIRD
ncbi:MAG: phenylalanine--tRNA ligase subunit beta, partial [Clostridia bacterium]|nr:phenylalanine--tRNA ligase subunit beta [Clostridia bacterium]